MICLIEWVTQNKISIISRKPIEKCLWYDKDDNLILEFSINQIKDGEIERINDVNVNMNNDANEEIERVILVDDADEENERVNCDCGQILTLTSGKLLAIFIFLELGAFGQIIAGIELDNAYLWIPGIILAVCFFIALGATIIAMRK